MQSVSCIAFAAVPFNDTRADSPSSGVTQWGYGHHNRDLLTHIRSSPEPLKVSSSYVQRSCLALKTFSFFG